VIGNDEAICPELIELDLSGNQILVIKLMKIAALKILNVSNNQIDQLTLSLPLLKSLNASTNKITSVNLVESKELENLDISNNLLIEIFTKINDVNTETNFANLPKLQNLNLSNNQLNKIDLTGEGVEGFELEMKELRKLNLSQNQFNLITDIQCLKDTAVFPKLNSIDLLENPFMSDAAIRNDKEYYDIKTQLLKDFRHLQELNRETITNKMLKKAFEFDS